MTKLSILCTLMLTCSSVYVNSGYANMLDCNSSTSSSNVGSSSINLNLDNDGVIAPMSPLIISLEQLPKSIPYIVTCDIANPNYETNAVDIGPSFTTAKPIIVNYAVNGKSFVYSAALTQSDNKFVASDVENVSSNLLCGRSTLNIGNEDQTDTVTVTSCVANPMASGKTN